MRKLVTTVVALGTMLVAAQAMAVSAGKTVEWQTPMGQVVFRGDDHAGKGMKCSECHSKIFKMKKGAASMKMADIYAGKYCGVCHNGKRAFKAAGNCAKCHKK
jgi:c(7)-type cytochrome triheme protein